MKTMKKRSRRTKAKLNRTAMKWINPKTNNLVGYPRAHALHLDKRKDVKVYVELELV